MLHIGRHGAAGIQDLAPTGTGPQEAKSPLGIREPPDGVNEGTGLGNAAAQEKLTPIRRTDGSSKKLEAGGAIPGAHEGLRRGASRDDLSLTEVDHETYAAEALDKGTCHRQGTRSRCRGPRGRSSQWTAVPPG